MGGALVGSMRSIAVPPSHSQSQVLAGEGNGGKIQGLGCNECEWITVSGDLESRGTEPTRVARTH